MDNQRNTNKGTATRVRGNHARVQGDHVTPDEARAYSRSTTRTSRGKHPAHAKESESLLSKVNSSSAGVVAGVALASSLVVISPAMALQGKDMSTTLTPPQISYVKPLAPSTPDQLLQNAGASQAAASKPASVSSSAQASAPLVATPATVQSAARLSSGERSAASVEKSARHAASAKSGETGATSEKPGASGVPSAPQSKALPSVLLLSTPAGAQGSSGAQGTSTSGQSNGSNPRTNDTSNQQVVRPNVQNPTAGDVQTANGQVVRPADERKTVYNLTVRYAVSGNVTKQLLQPTEFSFTEAKLEEISKPDAEGVYIPVPTTKGYVAPRGKYVKNAAGKFVLDTEQNASVQTYMRIDRHFIDQYKNTRLSKDDIVVSEFTLEYNPKQVTFYVRHMLQNPNYDPHITNPSDERSKPFIEYTGLNDKVQLQDEAGHWHTVCVSKAIGLVGSRVFAQPVNIEGYSPEPNLVGSSIPDDAYYTEADEDEATNPSTTEATNPSAKDKPKHLVFELRYLLKKHEVSYDVQGGTAIQGHVYKFGEKMLQVKNPTRRGYEFTGWTVKGIKGKEHEAPSLAPNFTEQTLPDNDVEFVAHWKPAQEETSYWVNVWVQKARLVKPNDPNSLDNYDYVGRVQRTGKSDQNIENKFTKYDKSFDAPTDLLNGKYRVIKGTLTAEERKQVHFDGLDTDNPLIKADVEKVLADDLLFDKFYKPNYQLENRLNAGEAPEWFGAKEMRPLYKLRPDGTTVLNAVYDRQVYTYYFAKPDGSKKSTDADPYSNPPKPGDPDYKGNARGSSTTVTIGGKKWTYDKDKLNSAYSIKVRFNEELRPGIEFPKTAQITYSPVDRTHDIDGREIDGSKEEPQANMGLYILGDATNFHKGKSDGDNVFDTPPYRFGFEDVYYTREVEGADFYNKKDFFCFSKHYHQDTSTTEVGSYDYNPYQRLFTPFPMDTRQFQSNEPSNGPFHVVIRVETPESAAARLKDPHAKPQYKISVMSYTQYNYIYRGEGKFDNSSLLGWDGFEPPKLIGYARGKSSSGGNPAIWNNEDEYFFGNSEQKPILDPNAPIPKTHMQCVYELLYQDYCTYLKAKGESPVALVGDKEKDKGEKERFKAYVYEKWKDAFDFTYKKVGENTYVQEGIDKNGKTKEVPVKYPFSAILVWTYDRTTPTIRFHNDASSDVEDAQGHAATIQSPFDTDLFKKDFIVGGHITDDGTTLTPTITPYTPQGQAPEQFPGTYRFQLNGKDYFIKRPDNLPKDYVFDGWALDANGSQVLIPHMKSDGTAMTAKDIIDYVNKQTVKRLLPDAGLTLYAHWVPSQVTHKITVSMNRSDMPNAHSEVFVTHGHHAHKAKNDGHVRDKKDIPKDEFPLPADRPGYVFYGWQVKTKDINGNDHWLPFAFSTPVVDDLEVRAEWVEDKRVTGTVRQVFLNPGCTIKQYEAAKNTNNTAELDKLIHNVRIETLHDLRPGSSTSVQAGYRDDEYFADHTYSTFVVNDNPDKNSAEFVYQPYTKRSYTVHYKDALGNEIAPAEPQEGNVSIYTTNKLNYNVVEAKTIPGYVLRKDIAPQYQFVIKPEPDGSYKASYDYTFVYDDVRILKRSNDNQVTPEHYSRLVFKTESTELVVDSNKHVISRLSAQPGGELKPFAFDPTAPESNVQEIVLDAVNGTKAYQLPLPTPVAKEGYTFVGWTSEDYYDDGQKYEGANRLPANSQMFDHKIVYIAHFKKTENAFVGSDPKAETPPGYYKVNYTADQNGRLQRVVSDGHGGTKTETLDTLTNVVVLDKYKVNNINAPTPVPDKGFQAIDGFTFEGNDAKDRTYTKHFVMIDPVAVEHRYVLPGNPVLAAGETAKSLIQNADQYKNEEDALPGKLATYRFLDEAGNDVTTLDNSTPGEHKIFIEVEAGREGYRVKKKVPFFYTIMPRAFLQGDLSKYKPQDVATYYKKYTFKSKPAQGIMTGRETAHQEGEYETLAAYVYAGTAAAPAGTYTLDVPSAAGRDFEANGYHYVFRGWKKVVGTSAGSSAPDTLPADFTWKNFTPDIGPKDHYKDIQPTDDAAYVAMYEKIPYIVQKSEDGTVPPDSVVVSFKPAAGRAWKDGSTGPKVLYIKKGMDISKLDEHGVPIKPGETKKSILQVLGEQLYGYTGDWTKSSMDGITLIDSMNTGAGTDGWKSNNAFQEFVARQTPYTDPVGGVEKTIVQGTAAPAAIDFVQNKNIFVPSETSTVESITAEYVEAPSTDAAANLTVPIKVTVKYKDSADATHTREYNITGALHVLSDVLKSDSAPSDPALKDKYTTITFVSKKQDAPLKSGQTVADKEDPGQVSGATEGADQSELQYLAYKKTGAKYTIAIPQVTGKDYTANGYHYVFTGWKKVQSGAHAQEVLVDASQRTLSFDAEENVVYEAQYKKVPYITTKTDDGSIPDDSVVAAFKPAPGRTWKDGTNGPKTFYVKKGQDVHNLPFDIEENGHKKHYKSIIDYFKDQLYDNTGWSKSSMEDVQGIESVGESDWIANNAFQEYVAKQTDYTLPVLGKAQTIVQGTTIPDAQTFISNIDAMKNAANVEKVEVSYTETPTSTEAANYTVPLKVVVTYKDSASQNKQKVYNLVGYLNVLGDVLEKKNAPSEQTLKDQYTTITFISKKQKVVDASGHETGQTEEPGQVSGASESADHTQSELEYLTFKKTGASYVIDVPKVTGLDYTENGYHYVFTGWKQKVVAPTPGVEPLTIGAADRNYTFDAQQNIVFEAQYKKVPYVVEKSDDGTVPPESVVVSFKPAAGRAWKDGSTGPKVLYIKKGVDISKIDQHGKPVTDQSQSILAWLGSQLYGYENNWTKSSMEGITLIDSMNDNPAAWLSNNAFQEFVAHQTAYTDPVGGVEKTIIKGTAAPAALDFVQNKDVFVPSETSTVESITAEYVKAPSTDAAANLTVPIKVTVKYKDSAEVTHTRVYNITGALHVLGDVLEKKNAPSEQTLKDQYTTITFVSKKQDAPLKPGQTVADKEDPGQVSGATEGAEQSELEYLTFKKTGASYVIDVPKVTGLDYTENGYHYVFTGWKQKVVTPTPGVEPLTIGAADRNYTFDAAQNIVFEAQYKKVPYVVEKSDDGTVPPDSVVVSFKPAAGRAWKDGSTGPKVLYIKKGVDISKIDQHGKPVTDEKQSILAWLGSQLYGYENNWTKSSMEGITLIDSMNDNPAAWLSNNAFQEFVAHQKSYVDPVGGVEKTIIKGTAAPAAIDFVQNKDVFVPSETSTVESITAEYVKAPSTDAAANLTVPIKVTVKYKDSAEVTHTRVYNITGALHVLGDVLEKKNAPTDPTLTNQYTTITFVSKKQAAPLKPGQTVADKEEPGQVSGASESADHTQSELEYLTFKKTGASYVIDVPKVTGLDYTENGYHYVFTGWKQKVVTPTPGVEPLTIGAADRNYTFDAQNSIVFEAQYKKVPYVVEKSDDGTVPPESVVVSFKPAAGRAWKDGSTGPKVLYIKKGVDISKIDQHGKPVIDEKQSILAWLGSQLYGYENNWTKSSMEGITLIDSMNDNPAAWLSNNAFQEFVAHQTAYTDPVGGVEKTIIKGTAAPAALDFVQNKDVFVPSETSTVESITAEYVKAPSTDAAANLTVPIKVTVKYKDSAETTHTRVYNITGALHVLGDVLEKKHAPSEQTLKDQYTTITFVSKKQAAPLKPGQTVADKEDPGQVSGATEGAEQSELEYLTFKKTGASYVIDVPKVTGLDYTENGYHYVFTGWKQKVVTPTPGVEPLTIGAADRNYTFDAAQNIVFEAQYKKVPYVVEKSDDGTVPPDSVVVSFKPAAGRAWKDGSTGPKVLYIKKGVDISKIDQHGKPVTDEKQSILAWLGSQLYGYENDWTKSSMEGITLIEKMSTQPAAWLSNNAFQEFVAHQTPYADPVGGVEKTIIKGTAAPAAIDFVQNADQFKTAEGTPFDSITAEYVKAPSTDAAANLTVPIKVTVKYKDSAEVTHTRVYNITGALHVLGDVLEKKNAPTDPTLTNQYTTITFVSKKQAAPLKPGQTVADKEDPGQVSGATEGAEQSELEYLTFKKTGASYVIDVPKVTGLDYTENGYHYVFTGWKQKVVTPTPGVEPLTIGAADRNYTFDAQNSIVFEAQYKKVPYVVEKSDDGTVPPDSVVVSFKPAAGRAWKDGSTGPKVLYIKKGVDISKIDQHGKPVSDQSQSILAWLGSQLYGYENNWTKSSMEGITLIDSMNDHPDAWLSNNAFQEFVAHQTAYTDPVGGVEKTIIKGTAAPAALDFVQNKDVFVPSETSTVESITAEYVKAPSTDAAANLTVPIKVTVKYKDSAETTHTRVYNITGALHVLGDVLEKKNAPTEQTLKDQYTTITFVSKKQDAPLKPGQTVADKEDPGQVSGATEGAEQSELEYLTFKKAGASYTIDVPKVTGLDYTKNGYHYVFTGWKQKVAEGTSAAPLTIKATDRNYTFDAQNNIVFEAQYKKVPYVVEKSDDGTVPPDSVVVSFKPAAGRAWKDGSTGPKVLYIKKGVDISKIDQHGKPVTDQSQSILAWLGSQLYGYENNWTKSSMEGITLIDSMKDHQDAWLSNNAFQEFVAHQKPVVDPIVKNKIFITQYGNVPDAKDFIDNMKALEGDNIALKDGKYDIEVHYGENDKKRPSSDAAGVYTVPIFITVKHADMAEPIVYKLTSVLHVMDKVLPDAYSKNIADQISKKEEAKKDPSKPVQYTEEEKQFKDNYAKVVFSSDIDTKGTPKGTLVGTATYYVRKNTDIVLDTPTVIAKENQIDAQTGKKFRYVFTGWQLVITQNTPGQGGTQAGSTQPGVAPQPGANAHASTLMRSLRYRRSLDAFTPFTTLVQNETPGSTPGASEGGSTPTTISVTVPAEDLKPENLGKTLRKIEAKYGKTFTDAIYTFVAQYDKQPYVIDASKQDTMRDGDVPVMFLPAPKHTWQNGSSRPYVFYSNADKGDITSHVAELKAKLGSFTGWAVYNNKGELVTDAAEIEQALKNPKHAYTIIAKQAEIPNLVPRDDVVITEGDIMPSYNEMVKDTPQINPETGTLLLDPNSQNPAMINGVEAFSTLKLNPRFAGWETDRDSYAKLSTDKPGVYRVRFGLKYYTDEQEIDPKTKQLVVENGKPKYKVDTKWVNVSVHILPRVIAEQDLPADGTREARFVKANYTKVTYRVALGDHGFLASPNTTFYVRRGYTIDPNALLNFDKDKRAKRLQDMQKHAVDQKQLKQEIGVPSAIAQPGYVFYEWQKHAANDKGDVVYLAHFHKLPITHFEFETSTEAEQPFSTRLIGDAQNYPLYKPKAGTKIPDGVTVTCNGDTCTVSGTPHITDWQPGETQRTIELHFEAVDQRVTYDENGVAQRTYRDANGKEQPVTDKYGRSSYGIHKEIVVKLVVKKPSEKTDDGAGSGGGYWYPKDGRYDREPQRIIVREAPGSKDNQCPVPAPQPQPQPQPRDTREQPPVVPTAAAQGYKLEGGVHAAGLPQTSDKGVASSAAELLAASFGALGALAFTRRRKQRKQNAAPTKDVNEDN